jgi:endogenous inhibitor of DNA gyrase (YacG/DUF329 family)
LPPVTEPQPPRIVACPQCGRAVEWTDKSRWKPFCSERCRLIDLGEWFNEEHKIPGDEESGEGNGV